MILVSRVIFTSSACLLLNPDQNLTKAKSIKKLQSTSELEALRKLVENDWNNFSLFYVFAGTLTHLDEIIIRRRQHTQRSFHSVHYPSVGKDTL
jgi:hypothetical protein